MDRPRNDRLIDDEIHAFLDGMVPLDERPALQARLAQDPKGQAKATQWQHQRKALQALHRDVLDEPVPAALVTAAHRATTAQQQASLWWRWGGMAAGVVLAFTAGWTAHGDWRIEAPSPTLTKVGPIQDFVRQAGFAHVVYAPEVRHPVEVTVAEQDHLVQWLSKRLGKPLKIPVLSALGYELVGGRLLPGETGARAQFMFQNAAGTRITLYLGAVEKVLAGVDARETGFQFEPDGPTPRFYWVEQGFGYALAGPVPRADLMKLAEAVYRQL
jgi:anti-sigma factor RsiW